MINLALLFSGDTSPGWPIAAVVLLGAAGARCSRSGASTNDTAFARFPVFRGEIGVNYDA